MSDIGRPSLDVTYTYDGNGNRTTIGYPAQVTAVYTYDHADRQKTLALSEEGNVALTLVSTASYKPLGPLASLSLGNGLVETRAYDERYHPSAIQIDGTSRLLDWSYTVDPVGNITAIQDVLAPVNSRTYGYQDYYLYFLTQGDGPWGPRSWTYDRIGNRLSETRGPFLTTDHLGTPVLATNDSGGMVWEGGFEPFGEDWNGADDTGLQRARTSWLDAPLLRKSSPPQDLCTSSSGMIKPRFQK